MSKLVVQLKQAADQAWDALSAGWRGFSARVDGASARFRATPTDLLGLHGR